jgi:lysophospholipase L1-like esterase
VRRVRDAGARILLSPLTPAGDATNPAHFAGFYSTAAGIADRFDVNNWIRHQSTAYSRSFDFERVVENPRDPNELLPGDDSGDHLHPNISGQQAMAASIPPGLIERMAQH